MVVAVRRVLAGDSILYRLPGPLLILSLLFAGTTVVTAEPQQVPARKMVAALQPFVDSHRIAGAVALVASKDKLLCLEAVGYSDLEARTLMRTDNFFWIASMTKPITTTALMMLVDEGKLNVNDPVEKYLPEFKELVLADANGQGRLRKPRHPVTVKELLSHTHGMAEAKTPTISLQDDVAKFVAAPMECDPGTKYKYSNVSMNAGGRIIEVLSGMSYADFMQQRLFTPLGMQDTTFWPDERQVQRLARTFRQTAGNSGIENLTYQVNVAPGPVPPALLLQYNAGMVPIYKNHYAGPSGGLYSTAADLLKFCQMLLGGGISGEKRYLSQGAIQQMTANQTGSIPVNPLEGYGLGWAVEKKEAEGHPSVGSFGHRGARKTMMWIDPNKQLVMILLLQSFDLPNKVQNDLYETFIKTAGEMSPASR